MDAHHRARISQVTDPVPVRYRVDRVLANTIEAELLLQRLPVDRERAPGDRARSEWEHRSGHPRGSDPFDIPEERKEVAGRPMRGADGLRLLQVRVPGHDDVGAPRRHRVERFAEARQLGTDSVRRGHAVEPNARRRLIVSRPPRMQLARDVAGHFTQHPLDDRVDVLVGSVGEALTLDSVADSCETLDERIGLLGHQHASPPQCPNPRYAATYVPRAKGADRPRG